MDAEQLARRSALHDGERLTPARAIALAPPPPSHRLAIVDADHPNRPSVLLEQRVGWLVHALLATRECLGSSMKGMGRRRQPAHEHHLDGSHGVTTGGDE